MVNNLVRQLEQEDVIVKQTLRRRFDVPSDGEESSSAASKLVKRLVESKRLHRLGEDLGYVSVCEAQQCCHLLDESLGARVPTPTEVVNMGLKGDRHGGESSLKNPVQDM